MRTALTAMLIAASMMALAACSTATVKARSIGNVRGFVINCSGMTSDWKLCYDKAETMCPAHGYKIVSKTTDVKEEEGDGFMGYSPGQYSRTLIIACKPPEDV